MKKIISFFMLLSLLPFVGYSQKDMQYYYVSVSMADGLELMKDGKDFILLDVRRPDEFSSGHIPGAVLFANETITQKKAEKLLKDKNQRILVYCRSGRRSKEASRKLADFGYTNVVEIGGIQDYSGNLER